MDWNYLQHKVAVFVLPENKQLILAYSKTESQQFYKEEKYQQLVLFKFGKTYICIIVVIIITINFTILYQSNGEFMLINKCLVIEVLRHKRLFE